MAVFAIDTDDPAPIYAQLERSIRLAIATGALGAGSRLPTVRQMAVDLKVNANTVARVCAELEREGCWRPAGGRHGRLGETGGGRPGRSPAPAG